MKLNRILLVLLLITNANLISSANAEENLSLIDWLWEAVEDDDWYPDIDFYPPPLNVEAPERFEPQNHLDSVEALEKDAMVNNPRKYECPNCHKSYNLKYDLARHMRTHNGERSFRCALCPSAFFRRNDLKTHVKIHTGEKSHVCSECGKAFVQKSNLTTHEKTHAEKKSLECEFCGKTFAQKSSLTRHKMAHKE